MTPEQEIYLAARARDVLDNEAYQQAYEAIRQEYVKAWINSPALDAEGREKLYLMIKLLDKVQGNLLDMLANGKKAKIDQEHEANLLAKQRAYGVSIG